MGRKLNSQSRNALFTLRHRNWTDLRALASSGVTEAEMEDLVDGGYVSATPRGPSNQRAWRLTSKGNDWVDRNLP